MLTKPPMGWNSYDYYDTTVNEEQVKANADFMAKNLLQAGWDTIVVDISWYVYGAGKNRDRYQYVPFAKVEMDEYSRLLPCPERFPSSVNGLGFKPLADYVHKLGLRFGIHIMRGIPRIAAHLHTKILGSNVTANEIADPGSICSWNPDMYGVIPGVTGAKEYYYSLLQLYASWGVDFVKCDDICRMDAVSSKAEIELIHEAIEACGREIVLSLSPGPALLEEAKFYYANANMWRITDDFWDHWDSLRDMFNRCRSWQGFEKEGGYPDCDMLPVGWLGKGFGTERRTNFTKDEQQTMLTLWCMCHSPLMIGSELTKLDDWTIKLLTNKSVLKLLTDAKNSREVHRDEQKIVWMATSREGKGSYTAIFNISEQVIRINQEDLGVGSLEGLDLWENCSIEQATICIPSHGCVLYQG